MIMSWALSKFPQVEIQSSAIKVMFMKLKGMTGKSWSSVLIHPPFSSQTTAHLTSQGVSSEFEVTHNLQRAQYHPSLNIKILNSSSDVSAGINRPPACPWDLSIKKEGTLTHRDQANEKSSPGYNLRDPSTRSSNGGGTREDVLEGPGASCERFWVDFSYDL